MNHCPIKPAHTISHLPDYGAKDTWFAYSKHVEFRIQVHDRLKNFGWQCIYCPSLVNRCLFVMVGYETLN